MSSSNCSVCCRHVRKTYRNIKCSLCKHYVHKQCTDLTNKEAKFKKHCSPFWHCKTCNDEIISLPFNHITNENEYFLHLYRFFEHENLRKNRFENLAFNPNIFEIDSNEIGCNSQCSYYTEDILNQVNNKYVNNMSMLNANIRSLYKNVDAFKDFICTSQINFEIIGLVETWLQDKPQEYLKLPGYNLEFQNRAGKKGGGVCLYIKDNVNYHVRNDFQQIKHPEYVESVFIEIERPYSKNVVIGNVYRPPGQDINEFNDFIDKILTNATKNPKIVYLMGDFNINLLNEDIHSLTNDFVNIILSHSLYPSITKPTRITSNTATLIDNIFTNSTAEQTSGIIMTDLSDHLPVFICTDLNISRKFQSENSYHEVRQYTCENVDKLKSELKTVEWGNICNSNDVNVSYTNFINKYNEIFERCVPLKKKKIHSQNSTPKSPWISLALLKSIKRKNSLYKKYLKNPSTKNCDTYKTYRNKLHSTLRMAKRNYFSDILEKERNNMRNTWKILNSILRPKTTASTDKFVSGDVSITCPKQIATEFNKYFASIGPKLASTIQHNGKNFSSYLKESNVATCFFQPTDENEIMKIISKLGSGKSAGHDNIKSDIIKKVAGEIAFPLSMIFNTSLSTGVVPDDFKIAKVVPIYKKDNPEIFGNYRPVSVLPCLSKILERIVYNRTYDFLCKNNVLYHKQYGFRTNHSTYMAVLDFVNEISKAVEEKKFTIGIFMDLSKAFDTIDHNILLQKLYHYGFRGISNTWFCNYLSNRKQYVSYNSVISQTEDVQCGVPQGSILGPLLFIIYMNDICHISNILNTILFADDTTVFYSHKNLSFLSNVVNEELKVVCDWFKANKLSLNAKKTNLMFLGTAKQTLNIDENSVNIYLDGCKLNRVRDAKFLGITIDENLTWKKQVETVCKLCSRNIAVLNKVKEFLPNSAMYQLYCTLILPYLNYGLLLWGNVNNEYLNKIFLLQKRALRTISKSSYLCPSKPLFEKYNVLNIFDMHAKEVAIFMYKYKNNLLPKSFDNCFVVNHDIHNYNTRNKDDFVIPKSKSKTIFTNGPKIWNKLSIELKQAKSLKIFKDIIKHQISGIL